MSRFFSARTYCAAYLALVLATTAGCAGEGSSRAEDASATGSKAEQVLRDWFTALTGAKTLSVETTATFQALQQGQEVEAVSQSYGFAIRRPQFVAIRPKDPTGLTIIADDKQLYESAGDTKRYAVKDQVETVGDLFGKSLLTHMVNLQQGLSLAGDALGAKSWEAFRASVEKVEYVGEEQLDGEKAHHLALRRQGVPAQAWLTVEAKPKLLKVVPDLKAMIEKRGRPAPTEVDLKLAVTFRNWEYDGKLPDDAFKIAPPSDFELVDDLFAPPPHPLLGKSAPDFELASLDGKSFKLAEHRGKVVVLDFWATWCGPCVAALPKITATTAKYKEKGVVFYAVNEDEEAPIIREFLTTEKLNPPVLLDKGGEVGTRFGVEGIPQTVVIDKNGKVQVVHVGAGENIGEQLAAELDDVLAGKELADAKLNKKK